MCYSQSRKDGTPAGGISIVDRIAGYAEDYAYFVFLFQYLKWLARYATCADTPNTPRIAGSDRNGVAMPMVEPGDPFARSDQLDALILEEEDLEDFFEGLMQYCREFGRELRKPDLSFEAVLLLRDFRAGKTKSRRGLITNEAHSAFERECAWRGWQLKEEILTLYSRRAA